MKALNVVSLTLLLLSSLIFTSCQKEDLDIEVKQFGPELNERAVYLKGSRALKAIDCLSQICSIPKLELFHRTIRTCALVVDGQ